VEARVAEAAMQRHRFENSGVELSSFGRDRDAAHSQVTRSPVTI